MVGANYLFPCHIPSSLSICQSKGIRLLFILKANDVNLEVEVKLYVGYLGCQLH